jgi:hypothetical protein
MMMHLLSKSDSGLQAAAVLGLQFGGVVHLATADVSRRADRGEEVQDLER